MEDRFSGIPQINYLLVFHVGRHYAAPEIFFIKLVSWRAGLYLHLHLLEFSLIAHENSIENFSFFWAGELEGDAEEGVEGDGDSVAVGAGNFGSVLSCEEVGDEGVVSFLVVLPADAADLLIGPPVALHLLGQWLYLDLIQIFVKLIEEIVEKLLAVLMVVSSELRVPLQDAEDVSGLQSPLVGSIEIFDELAESTGHVAVAAEDVGHVEVFEMLVS